MTDAASLNSSPLHEPSAFARSEDLTVPIVVYVLYLCAIPTAFLSLVVGVIIAYASRADAGPAAPVPRSASGASTCGRVSRVPERR